MIFSLVAPSFTRRLKVIVTAALLAPLLTGFLWLRVIGDIDDGHPAVIFGVLGIWLAVWLRMAFVAFRPMRTIRVRFQLEQV